MIQRKQTLFLLQIAFLSISLFFIPVQYIAGVQPVNATLLPLNDGIHSSTLGHFGAIALNLLGLILSLATIFLYKKRELQVKFCYVILAIYIVLPLMMAFCPFIQIDTVAQKSPVNVFGFIVSGVCIVSAYLAAHFTKKDIELIKSADRIR